MRADLEGRPGVCEDPLPVELCRGGTARPARLAARGRCRCMASRSARWKSWRLEPVLRCSSATKLKGLPIGR
eukprot:5884568-Pyramimonas_sp.AAC.1